MKRIVLFTFGFLFIAGPLWAEGVPSLPLEEAFKITLKNFYHADFIDRRIGLPFETIDLINRKPLTHYISGGDICEQYTPYWLYYFGTKDEEIEKIIKKVCEAMLMYLDPGTGLIGCHSYDTKRKKINKFIGSSKYGYWQDAEHGGEALLYCVLPYAWHFKSKRAVRCLERAARTLLKVNKSQKNIHFHLYIGLEPNGRWKALDYSGKKGMVEPSPQAYTDMYQFYWVLPVLSAGVFTEDEVLKNKIIKRIKPLMDDIITLQDKDTGQVPFCIKMDGSSGKIYRGYFDITWPLSVNRYDKWIQASYFMYHLTKEKKYIRAVDRFWDWYFSYPSFPMTLKDQQDNSRAVVTRGGEYHVYPMISLYIFHSYYTGHKRYLKRVEDWIKGLRMYKLDGNLCVAKGLGYALGNEAALREAMEMEEKIRDRDYKAVSGYYYYLDGIKEEHLTRFPTDNFRDLIHLKHKGEKAWGLTYRNMLALGWLMEQSQ